jgi:serine/threonine-protein kinase
MSPRTLGRYDIVNVLGKGAMGLVYEGHDPRIRRQVAIKTIWVEQLSDEMVAEFESRFRSEVRAAGRLHHPNIVAVYDAGRDGDVAYLVMELVHGGDLKGLLDSGRPLLPAQAFRIMKDLLSALDYAHERGVIHRDIKPANVLLDREGRVKLTDFGVARLIDSGDLTKGGSIVGTPKYMSPEQVRGERVDGRSDLFSAGVLLYQMLTGARPFEAPTDYAVWQLICSARHAPVTSHDPALPREIDSVLDRAMAKHREERYATAAEFAQALLPVARKLSRPRPTQAPEESPTGDETTVVRPYLQDRDSLPSAGGAARHPRLVTQEMELLYWKEIRQSNDAHDFSGFLRKFPEGIYARLARRRLRQLVGPGPGSTGGMAPPETDDAGDEQAD